ncbi:carbohydrate kinase family protein [Evansella cellulosilytica]|uniref:PfkB domain protein n=1 Tax=Evansella cellulosilytica (strain ATCC 21833 / DSM 2522 / FERM P-1141 / JCM 9156 / N-4) TaxID=649639 RepID=E6TXU2_EVAC2|nr:carbohydrate kinase [Evansella cellulosilytica]ADU30018.1 PfkB domain protein [Evansella cellulosilytica DSM 2522]
MGILFAIGEVLIDFIPNEKGLPLKDVISFEKAPGGAPANVAAAVAKYGEQSEMITKLGTDAFGDFLIDVLKNTGVNTEKVFRTSEANTALAFVSLKENGERDFSFYRNPSADLLLTEAEVDSSWFNDGDILHFCSVDLVDSPMKEAHRKAIQSVIQNGGIVSFDPNVRLPLWDSQASCRNAIREFLPEAHLVKISDEELTFITGISEEESAIQSLFKGNVQAVIYTKGAKGADLYLKGEDTVFTSKGYLVDVQDTTGAGDAFIGGFLYQLLTLKAKPETLKTLLSENYQHILSFANASGALTTTGKGAISALPTKKDILSLINN